MYIDIRSFKKWLQGAYNYLEMLKNNQNYAQNIQMCPKSLEISFQDFCRQIWQICRQFLVLPAINFCRQIAGKAHVYVKRQKKQREEINWG